MGLPHRISTLLYCFNRRGEVLLLERARAPNRGLWSPPGGKLHTGRGESPYACACREAREELGLELTPRDLHLAGLVSEHGYEGQAHWLMFLFEVKPRLDRLPPTGREGRFAFFARAALAGLAVPATDREMIWPLFWRHRGGFFAAHCRVHPDGRRDWLVEETRKRRPASDRLPAGSPAESAFAAGAGPADSLPSPPAAAEGGEAASEQAASLNRRRGQASAEVGGEGEPVIDLHSDAHFMDEALRQARKAAAAAEVPVGAVITHAGRVIARAHNQVELLKDATAHAEMLALTQAQAALGDWRLNACTLYVTKEPCPMCAGAIVQARVGRVVFGAPDPKVGAAGGALNLLQCSAANHRCQVTAGVRQEECQRLLRDFFHTRRAGKNGEEGPTR